MLDHNQSRGECEPVLIDCLNYSKELAFTP